MKGSVAYRVSGFGGIVLFEVNSVCCQVHVRTVAHSWERG